MKNKGAVIGLLLAATVISIPFITTMQSADAAVVFAIQVAFAGQEPQYLTFDNMGQCHQFVKDNLELQLTKDDCQKGAPPEEPPTDG